MVVRFIWNLLQDSLTRNQKVCLFNEPFITMFNCELPLPAIFLPYRFYNFVVQVHIPIEIPFFGCLFDIRVYVLSCGIEVAPVRFGIERESLQLLILRFLQTSELETAHT
jgi:hypothetical protein